MGKNQWSSDNVADQSGRLVVITGATSGIGKETAKVLAGKNAQLVIGARNLAKAELVKKEIENETGNTKVLLSELDLTSLSSVKDFSDFIINNFNRLDVLINNAGIMVCPFGRTEDGFEMQMGTNHLGHFALTGRLMPLLKKTANSRIVILSSFAHKMGRLDLADLNWEKRKYNTNKAYADSKLANLYFLSELTRRLKDDPLAPVVSAAHPGWTKTELQRHTRIIGFLNHFFAQSSQQGALPTLRAGFDEDVCSGDFYGPEKYFEMHGAPVKVATTELAKDASIAKKLWHKSEQLTGVHF